MTENKNINQNRRQSIVDVSGVLMTLTETDTSEELLIKNMEMNRVAG